MVDVVDKPTRSRMMSGIRGKNTTPEIAVRKALFAEGYRFRLHRSDLPGRPDIVLPGRKVVIFVHGCFWHQHAGCKHVKIPSTNADFWEAKLKANVMRDERAILLLHEAGWRVLVIWECAVRRFSASDLRRALVHELGCLDEYGEIPSPEAIR